MIRTGALRAKGLGRLASAPDMPAARPLGLSRCCALESQRAHDAVREFSPPRSRAVKLRGQHVQVDVTPMRRYEDFAADVKARL